MTTAAPPSSARSTPRPASEPRRIAVRRPGARDPASAYRRIAWSLLLMVIIPSALMMTIGVTLLFKEDPNLNLVLGILVLCFCLTLGTGATLIWVFIYKAQNLSQLQTDFVSKISHELKTPLTSIMMFVETLRMKRVTEPTQVDSCIELLGRETERLTERIERLLDWGRMEAGRWVYDLHEGDVAEVAREAFESASAMKPMDTDAAFSLDIEPDLPTTQLDRAALLTAIANLLSNAYKYSGQPRKVAMRVTSSADRRRVLVAVSDNGDGIPAHEHKRIFQKFYRRDDRLSRSAEGSGIGLAIVAHIVRGHGGRVRVESEVGKGSTFVIELPASAA